MTSEPRRLLNRFELLTVTSVCVLLFIVMHREVGLAFWSIPAITLFAVAGLTLLSVLLSQAHRTLSKPSGIGLRRRRPSLVVAVALANKTARIAWAVMHRQENYQRMATAA